FRCLVAKCCNAPPLRRYNKCSDDATPRAAAGGPSGASARPSGSHEVPLPRRLRRALRAALLGRLCRVAAEAQGLVVIHIPESRIARAGDRLDVIYRGGRGLPPSLQASDAVGVLLSVALG